MSEPAHSPVGGSGMERWINCAGSVSLLAALAGDGERDDDTEYSKAGTAEHAALADALTNNMEAWELGAREYHGVTMEMDNVNAVELALEECRKHLTPAATVYIEHDFHRPEVHPGYRGRMDFAAVYDSLLVAVEYKGGAGVPVIVEDNRQLKYYAYDLILRHPGVRRVVLKVVQPRAWATAPVQRWETTAEEICEWAERELVPGMKRCDTDKSLVPGEWCQFCPAKLICPVLTGMFEAAVNADPAKVGSLSDAALAMNWRMIDGVRKYINALDDEMFKRAMEGRKMPGAKLVLTKANRVWKDGAEAKLTALLGQDAYTEPKLRSPAQIEKLSDRGKDLALELAYTPQAGVSLVSENDKRPEVTRKTSAEVFANYKG